MVNLQFELSQDQADALAQLIKRIPGSSLRENATDEDEAYAMQDALNQVRVALSDQGFSPR